MVSECKSTGIFHKKTSENVDIHINQKDLEERRVEYEGGTFTLKRTTYLMI